MHKGAAALHEEIVKLEAAMTLAASNLKLWMYGFAGALLTLIAHSFKWI
jgi:hypothetical protein